MDHEQGKQRVTEADAVPDLSIVIVNWNTRELLRGCLASIPDACPDLSWEVLVVDNNSADDSAAMVRQNFPNVKLIEAGSNCGFSRGNNIALPQTTGDFVLLLNPDTICLPKSLAELVGFARSQPNLGAVGPLLTGHDRQPTISYGFFPRTEFHWLGAIDPLRRIPVERWRRRVVRLPERSEHSHRVDYIVGACFLMPRAALTAVGLLDEKFFMYFEETDWCYRARQLGLEVWYCSEAEVIHLEGQAAGIVSHFSNVQLQKSYRIFVAKHYRGGKSLEFRMAQFAEYSVKALLRTLLWFRGKNKALARVYLTRAMLQLKSRIDIEPPA